MATRAEVKNLTRVIVDLAKPPTGKLSLSNVYVALSRSAGRESICLLRDFDTDPDLSQDDERLE
jgi:hypothetical protein